MTSPLRPMQSPFADYDAFAEAALGTCLISDPWAYSRRRFDHRPWAVERAFAERLWALGRDIGALYDELARWVWEEPALLDAFYGYPPYYRAMWLASGGAWHGFARLDAFLCTDGSLQVCEINADTPSGQSDTAGCSAVFAGVAGRDLNAEYLPRLRALLDAHCARLRAPASSPVLALIYPTDVPEDLPLVDTYLRAFSAWGYRVVLGSPFNLQREGEGIALFGQRVDLLLRHYKTDWWGERETAHALDPPIVDTAPLEQTLWLLDAERRGEIAVVNPFGAIVAQDKRTMALAWSRVDRLSERGAATLRAHVPPTYRLADVDIDAVRAEKDRWVLKSDFGCESDEVVVGALTSQSAWESELEGARPTRWVVQEFFDAAPIAEGGVPNLGVYVIAGETAGLYVRVARPGSITAHGACVVAPFVPPVGC